MKLNMILSASGWRKVFAESGNEQDSTASITNDDYNIAITAADTFLEYLINKTEQDTPVIAIGMDTRPTGPKIADAMVRILLAKNAVIQYLGVTAAPEIMAYAKKLDGFIYISASHNPIGHNGIKFGLNDGGVLNAQENAILTEEFKKRIANEDYLASIKYLTDNCSTSKVREIESEFKSSKHNALKAYHEFMNETITGEKDVNRQNQFFSTLLQANTEKPVGVVCDFNGSARTVSIDREYFAQHKINFYTINDKPGQIVHEIIPEAENLVYVAQEMEKLHHEGHDEVILGYMPDCDGDRGNIVYWDETAKKAVILKAQEVFSLSVLAELSYSIWQNRDNKDFRPAVAVNCPTSMRIEEIAHALGAEVFRAEVGEANVVNLAREKREQGYTVRILGEGSNGGTITYPSSVRDPLNTIFALVKLLSMKNDGLFELWCKALRIPYNRDFTLNDIIKTLPVYTTTGVSEPCAILHIKNTDHADLKKKFQKHFEEEWNEKKDFLKKEYNIYSYEAIITNGTKETCGITDYSLSKKGGLKIVFKDQNFNPVAFMWMRGSGTEPVFRIMCDVKGDCRFLERMLIEWETSLLQKADK